MIWQFINTHTVYMFLGKAMNVMITLRSFIMGSNLCSLNLCEWESCHAVQCSFPCTVCLLDWEMTV